MEYIIHKDFNTKAICGEVNLPTGTVCNEYNGLICHEGKALCVNRSENAYKHFARNDDGNGLKRGELIRTLKDTLSGNEEAWERVWEDAECATATAILGFGSSTFTMRRLQTLNA